jgi:hypothetical protein
VGGGACGVSDLSNGSAVFGVGIPRWLIDLGPLGLSAIIGGTVVAALNHLLTARRERGKWLRELQVKANQDFFRAMQNVIDLVGQHVSRDLHYNDDHELPGHAATMDQLLVEFGNKWSDLVMVAEKRTRRVSEVVADTLPVLGRLAVPLPGVINRASRSQTAAALDALVGLAAYMLLVMRDEVGLIGFWQWRTRWELRFGTGPLATARTRSKPAFELTADEEPGGPPSPYELLQFWELRPLGSDDVPEDAEGYVTNNDPYQILVDDGEFLALPAPESQALLIKSATSRWRFGMSSDTTPLVRDKLLRDVGRIVTGHNSAFEAELRPFHSPAHQSDVWLWKGIK